MSFSRGLNLEALSLTKRVQKYSIGLPNASNIEHIYKAFGSLFRKTLLTRRLASEIILHDLQTSYWCSFTTPYYIESAL